MLHNSLYTLRETFREELTDASSLFQKGESILQTHRNSHKCNITVFGRTLWKDENDNLFKAYVCVDKKRLVAKWKFASFHQSII